MNNKILYRINNFAVVDRDDEFGEMDDIGLPLSDVASFGLRDTMVAGILTLDDKAVLEKTKHICEGWGFDDLVPEKAAFNPDGEEEQKEKRIPEV